MKIIHILGYDEFKFNIPLVEMLFNKNLDWKDNFFFATNNKNLFNKLSEYKNTIYFKEGIALFINRIWKKYDLIVIQGWNESVARASILNKKAAKHVVWRFWGTDYFPWEEAERLRTRILGRLLFKRLSKIISNFYAIGYGGITDIEFIKKRFSINSEVIGLPLSFRFQKGVGDEYKRIYQYALSNENKQVKIMVGHSANIRDNHISTLKRLSKFKEENIEIILVMSYGNREYGEYVCDFARKEFGNKLLIVKDMMSLQDYRLFLATIDIFITEAVGSTALGNISDLTYFGKKIFVLQNSFLDNYLDETNVDHFYVNNIEKMSFNQFIQYDFDTQKNHNACLWKEDDYYTVKCHKRLYDSYRQYLKSE